MSTGSGMDTLHLDVAGAIDFGNIDGNAATGDRGKISGSVADTATLAGYAIYARECTKLLDLERKMNYTILSSGIYAPAAIRSRGIGVFRHRVAIPVHQQSTAIHAAGDTRWRIRHRSKVYRTYTE